MSPRDSGDAVNEYLAALSTFVDERVKVALATDDLRGARMRVADAAGESLEIAFRKALAHAAAGLTSRVPTFTAPTSRSSQRIPAQGRDAVPPPPAVDPDPDTDYPEPFPLHHDSEPPPSSADPLPPLPRTSPTPPGPSTMVGGFPKPDEASEALAARRSTGPRKA